jgi:hypothetical protein
MLYSSLEPDYYDSWMPPALFLSGVDTRDVFEIDSDTSSSSSNGSSELERAPRNCTSKDGRHDKDIIIIIHPSGSEGTAQRRSEVTF